MAGSCAAKCNCGDERSENFGRNLRFEFLSTRYNIYATEGCAHTVHPLRTTLINNYDDSDDTKYKADDDRCKCGMLRDIRIADCDDG
eukprot:scaffold73009_cov29-Prasinocladus_malaysianus.AAC.1